MDLSLFGRLPLLGCQDHIPWINCPSSTLWIGSTSKGHPPDWFLWASCLSPAHFLLWYLSLPISLSFLVFYLLSFFSFSFPLSLFLLSIHLSVPLPNSILYILALLGVDVNLNFEVPESYLMAMFPVIKKNVEDGDSDDVLGHAFWREMESIRRELQA